MFVTAIIPVLQQRSPWFPSMRCRAMASAHAPRGDPQGTRSPHDESVMVLPTRRSLHNPGIHLFLESWSNNIGPLKSLACSFTSTIPTSTRTRRMASPAFGFASLGGPFRAVRLRRVFGRE